MSVYRYHVPHDGVHWNIRQILPYQRGFNFINSTRSIGKTYTTLGYFIDRFLYTEGEEQCLYLVRTDKEKEKGAGRKAFAKVCAEKFSDYEFQFTTEAGYLRKDKNHAWQQFEWTIAIMEHQKIKPNAYPFIHWGLMDEYMIESVTNKKNYVDGWQEPEHVISIYHTIDRDEDRLKMFFMGNNTQFYNPYHLNPIFKIPYIEKGDIWTSANVLFQRAIASEKLQEIQKKSKFGQMIKGSSYAKYATEGDYFLDNVSFIGKKPANCNYFCTVKFNNEYFALWIDSKHSMMYVDRKVNQTYMFSIAVNLSDHDDNTQLIRGKNTFPLRTIRNYVNCGQIRYYNMEVKNKFETFLPKIM